MKKFYPAIITILSSIVILLFVYSYFQKIEGEKQRMRAQDNEIKMLRQQEAATAYKDSLYECRRNHLKSVVQNSFGR
jgi:hypothetical protein